MSKPSFSSVNVGDAVIVVIEGVEITKKKNTLRYAFVIFIFSRTIVTKSQTCKDQNECLLRMNVWIVETYHIVQTFLLKF